MLLQAPEIAGDGRRERVVSCAGYTTCNVCTQAFLHAVLQYGQSHFFKLPGGKLKPDEDGEGRLLLSVTQTVWFQTAMGSDAAATGQLCMHA
jgi:hypothetical protein